MIGRDRELVRLADATATGGVVTLTGPGGVGKTRLVTEFATLHQDRTGEVVTIGLLASLPPDAGVPAIVDALGFESLDAATVVLAERGGLVVLDNCEHVLDVSRQIAAALAGAASCVLATSRQPLGVAGERVMVVDPLAVPAAGGAGAEDSAAVALFLERATAAGAVLEPTPDVLADVGELCRRLDGLPLAIELAAARARSIGVGELLAAVDQRLDLLRRTRPSAGHESMRAAIELSTALLAPGPRALFRRIGVFSGPFELGVAHAVAGEPGADRLQTLDGLAGLVDRSLLGVEVSGPVTRYRLLDLLREHAVDELRAADEVGRIEERFVDAMVATADEIVAAALRQWGPAMLAAASSQYANLVRACELCLQRDEAPDRAYRLLLPMFAAVHEGRPDEVWQLGVRVRARWPECAGTAWGLEVLAVLASAAAIAGRHDDVVAVAQAVVDDPGASSIALALADRAWGLAARSDDPADAARHFELARIAAERAGFTSMALEVSAFRAGELDLAGDTDEALVVLAGVLAASAESGDVFVDVLAHLISCRIRLRAGELDDAAADLAVAAEAATGMGQPWWTAAILRTRACVTSLGPGGWGAAAASWREAVDTAAGRGELGEVAITLRTAAAVAHHLGEHDTAGVLWAAAPRSSAITVLPELFPASARALVATGTSPPQGVNLLAALRRARAALGTIEEQPPGPGVDAVGVGAELVLEGDTWRIGFAGRTVRVRDVKGIGDIVVLVGRPRVEVHALELMGAADVGGTAGPVLDDVARRQYQARIVDLQRDIDAARADHDGGRAARAEVELDALVEQLSDAFGLGGRSRATGSSAERARTAVTYRVRAAIRRISEVHPELGRHLTNAVKTGTWCSYRPESDVTWTIDRLTV